MNEFIDDDFIYIFRPWITVKGQRLYRPDGKMWKLKIRREKFRY